MLNRNVVRPVFRFERRIVDHKDLTPSLQSHHAKSEKRFIREHSGQTETHRERQRRKNAEARSQRCAYRKCVSQGQQNGEEKIKEALSCHQRSAGRSRFRSRYKYFEFSRTLRAARYGRIRSARTRRYRRRHRPADIRGQITV